MIRPWKIFRVVLWAGFVWFLLVLLWAFLPSPSTEHEGDNGTDYPTKVLQSGRTLTRVYDARDGAASSNFYVAGNPREAFALDYKIDNNKLTLSIDGIKVPIPILKHELLGFGQGDITQQFTVPARIGDSDGANLPWFHHADAILLWWWIHRETFDIPVTARWSTEENEGACNLGIAIAGSEPLLAIRLGRGNAATEITATVPARPRSSSPSITYPIRVAIIRILGPTGRLVNSCLEFIDSWIGDAVIIFWAVAIYGFIIAAVIISFMRCLGGPSLEVTVQAAQDRLERWKHIERLRFLHLGAVQDGVDWAYHNKQIQAVVRVCQEGWHPERDRERRQSDEEADVEKGDSNK